jgi:hypothetical protein
MCVALTGGSLRWRGVLAAGVAQVAERRAAGGRVAVGDARRELAAQDAVHVEERVLERAVAPVPRVEGGGGRLAVLLDRARVQVRRPREVAVLRDLVRAPPHPGPALGRPVEGEQVQGSCRFAPAS